MALRDKPIVSSRLQKDFYYITMGYFAWKLQQQMPVKVRTKFANRSRHVMLGERVDFGRLREELAHVATLRYTEEELLWMWSKFGIHAKDGFLEPGYIEYLRTTPLSDYDLEPTSDHHGFRFEAYGDWSAVMDWETFQLPITTELNGDWVAAQAGVSRQMEFAEAGRRLGRKIELARQHPKFHFSSFGLRRQRCFELSEFVDRTLIQEIPEHISGISNVHMAKLLDWPVSGTFAHQGPMVYSALWGDSDAEVRASHMRFFDDWMKVLGPKWCTAVLDTFGSKAFFEDFGPERAAKWRPYKIDSGNAFHEVEQLYYWLREQGVNPREKIPVPTDGLTMETGIALHLFSNQYFDWQSYGIGTNLSNDTGLPTSGSFVVKAYECNGRKLAKLSNNLDKASGTPEAVAQFKRVHGYVNVEHVDLVV